MWVGGLGILHIAWNGQCTPEWGVQVCAHRELLDNFIEVVAGESGDLAVRERLCGTRVTEMQRGHDDVAPGAALGDHVAGTPCESTHHGTQPVGGVDPFARSESE